MAALKAGWILRSVCHGNQMIFGIGCKSLGRTSHITPIFNISHSYTTNKATDDIDKTVEENLQKIREGDFSQHGAHPEKLAHFRNTGTPDDIRKSTVDHWRSLTHRPGETIIGTKKDDPVVGATAMEHPIWSKEDLHNIKITHKKPKGIIDHMALASVKTLRRAFDIFSGFNNEPRSEKTWIMRIIFLETVAGVPGMVAAMVRHLHSLRRMRRDHGWIHTLLQEAENERMHLLTALCLRNPGIIFRYGVLGTQAGFVTFFSIAYMISPHYCHRFVGYLEEEAVVTYTKLLKDMDGGSMDHWNRLAAPPLSIAYWQLKPEATMYDVILAIRADEAHHRVVNHTLGSMKENDYNPYKPGH